MERRSNRIFQVMTLLLLCQILCGCPSFRIDRITDGAEVKPLPQEFAVGKTTLADVLNSYGAPSDLVDMKGLFSIHYQRTFYRGGQFSLGIPLNDLLKMSPSFDTTGNLTRYDEAVFIFTPDGILSNMMYEKGTDHPLWKTYWQ